MKLKERYRSVKRNKQYIQIGGKLKVYILTEIYHDEDCNPHSFVKSVWSLLEKAEKEIDRLCKRGYNKEYLEIEEIELDKEEN